MLTSSVQCLRVVTAFRQLSQILAQVASVHGKARRHNATGSLARADAGVRRRHSALDPGLRRRTPLPEAEAVPPAQQLPLSCFASDGTPPGTFWKGATVPPRTRRPFRIQSAGTSSVVRTHAAELPSERVRRPHQCHYFWRVSDIFGKYHPTYVAQLLGNLSLLHRPTSGDAFAHAASATHRQGRVVLCRRWVFTVAPPLAIRTLVLGLKIVCLHSGIWLIHNDNNLIHVSCH